MLLHLLLGTSVQKIHSHLSEAFDCRAPLKDHREKFFTASGEIFYASCTLTPLSHNGQTQGAVLEFQDITQRIVLERQKDDFLSVASHELRTPVTSIKAYAQILQQRFRKRGDTSSEELMSKMDRQLTKLTILIRDLLDVTKMESGQLLFREGEVALNALVSRVVEETQVTSPEHHLELELGAPVVVWGDEDRLGQVLTNLLINALKYSSSLDAIVIRTHLEHARVVVSVQDNGVGIPAEKTPHIFERFFRVSEGNRETYPGLGLGLYISTEIVKRHGGELWVESVEGEGSTFYFSLPFGAKS